MEIKNKKHLANAMSYFDSLVSDFVTMEDKPIIQNRGRDIYMTPRSIQRVRVAYQSEPRVYLQKMIRSDLTIAVMEWMKTRVTYDSQKKYPALNMINWLAWQEVGTVHFYLIFQEEALYDVVPANLNKAVIHWAKCTGRFMDATCYPKLKCYFDTTTHHEDVADASDSTVLEMLKQGHVLGDIQEHQSHIEYKVYNGDQDYGKYNGVTLEDHKNEVSEILNQII